MKSEVGPSYPFYASDFNGSTRVQRMTLEEECCYRRLLDTQMAEGKIPSDLRKLSKICKNISVSKMKKIWEVVGPHFAPLEDGSGYINLRQDSIRKELIAFRLCKSEAGKKGNQLRWGKSSHSDSHSVSQTVSQTDRKAIAQRIANGSPSISIPISPSQDPIPINTASPPKNSKPQQAGRAGDLLQSVRNHWQAVLRYIRKEHASSDQYARLFRPIEVSSAEGEFLILRVPPELVANYDGDIGATRVDLLALIEKSGADFLRDRKLALEVLD